MQEILYICRTFELDVEVVLVTDAASVSDALPSDSAAPAKGKRSRPQVEQELIQLQQQTLAGVKQLLTIQQQLLEVKKAKLEMQRELGINVKKWDYSG